MSKQSSIEWFADKIDNWISYIGAAEAAEFNSLFQQAKEMHRDEIIWAVEYGNRKGYDEHTLTCVDDLDVLYYEEIYGKGEQP